MNIKQLIGTALLGFGLNYCASMPLNYQGQLLTQTDQQRFVELKDKVDYLKSVSKIEYQKAEQDILSARNADEFYEAKTRHTLFEIMNLKDKDPHFNRRVEMKLTSFSLDLENSSAIEKWTREPHVSGREYNLRGNFTSTCPGLERIDHFLQKKGINLGSYEYPFPVSKASEHLGELWRERNSCNQ